MMNKIQKNIDDRNLARYKEKASKQQKQEKVLSDFAANLQGNKVQLKSN